MIYIVINTRFIDNKHIYHFLQIFCRDSIVPVNQQESVHVMKTQNSRHIDREMTMVLYDRFLYKVTWH